MTKNIKIQDFSLIKNDEDIFLLDVRTPSEYAFTNIGGINIPLDSLDSNHSNIKNMDKNSRIYCLCHHGVRSLYAADFLTNMGYNDVSNIEGGIDAWSNYIDPSVKKY